MYFSVVQTSWVAEFAPVASYSLELQSTLAAGCTASAAFQLAAYSRGMAESWYREPCDTVPTVDDEDPVGTRQARRAELRMARRRQHEDRAERRRAQNATAPSEPSLASLAATARAAGKPANLPTSTRPPLGDIYSDRAAQLVHPELAAEMVRVRVRVGPRVGPRVGLGVGLVHPELAAEMVRLGLGLELGWTTLTGWGGVRVGVDDPNRLGWG